MAMATNCCCVFKSRKRNVENISTCWTVWYKNPGAYSRKYFWICIYFPRLDFVSVYNQIDKNLIILCSILVERNSVPMADCFLHGIVHSFTGLGCPHCRRNNRPCQVQPSKDMYLFFCLLKDVGFNWIQQYFAKKMAKKLELYPFI